LFQLGLEFLGKCQRQSCYQLLERKSWKTGLLTPPKETAAARAVRLVPRVGYSKQGQVRFHPFFADCYIRVVQTRLFIIRTLEFQRFRHSYCKRQINRNTTVSPAATKRVSISQACARWCVTEVKI
jgi:hypothetical protein